MDQANIDVSEEQEVPVEDTGTNRNVLHSCLRSFGSGVAIFFLGMMMGVPGGGLQGRVAVVVLHSLELLAEDKPLMDHLKNYINTIKDYDNYIFEKINMAPRSDNVHMLNVFISILAEECGGLIGIFSLAVGLSVGSFMYKLMMEMSSESAIGKAFSLAGTLGMMVMSTVGCLLGLLLHLYLSITLTVIICCYFFMVVIVIAFAWFESCGRYSVVFSILTMCLFSPLNTPIVVCLMFFITFTFHSKLVVSSVLITKTSPLRNFAKPYGFDITTIPISFSMIIADVFNFAKEPIVILQQANATSTSSAVVEGVFVGVLASHFLMVSMGLLLISIGVKKGQLKIWAGAFGSGGAAIAVLERTVPLLGAGPTIGALMGVAWVVGISFSAAVSATFRYGQQIGMYRIVGLFGVTAGAAVGACLTSSTQSGLSALYMSLSIAAIPGSLFLPLIHLFLKGQHAWPVIRICLFVLLAVFSAVWVYFTIPIQGVLAFICFWIVLTAAGLVLVLISCAFHQWGPSLLRHECKNESDPSAAEDQSRNRMHEIIELFSLNNLSPSKLDFVENMYNEAGSKLVHLKQGLRQRLRLSESNIASDSM